MRLKGKFAVIIGGAVGLGAAITNVFSREGCDLLITYCGEKEKPEASKIEEKVKKFGVSFYYEELDILKRDHIRTLFSKKLPKYTEKLDIAVNNAGVSTMRQFIDLTEEDWDFNMDVNAKGVFFCCQEEAKIMVQQNYGKIINTGSIASKIGAPMYAPYAASKFAILGFSYTMALELAKYNILVNTVCPSVIETGMTLRERKWESELTGIAEADIAENKRKNIPLGRYPMPEEIANVFLFLASDESKYITGQAINVNGGRESH